MAKESLITEIKELFTDEGEIFEDGDEEELRINPPNNPGFPWLIFGASLFVDIIDVLELTLVGIIITKTLSFFLLSFIFLWIILRGSHWWQKGIMRWIFVRFGITAVIEATLGIFPATTIFVLLVHRKEKKIVRLFFSALDRLKTTKAAG